MTTISKGERDELRRMVNERARLAKHGIEARQAELLADVEAERGIRPEFRPRIDLQWYRRGVNAIKDACCPRSPVPTSMRLP